ncbi:hypothetical protein C8R48DRAFT_769354 [Suillus tomentosus]|nr:hypothetical protein C8R48DRAFT_769354 [Suillus tomentosus]
MVRNVFDKRDIAVPDSPHGRNVEGAPKMDHETQEWPIPEEFVSELDELKYHYQADPLPLYHDGHLVEPSHVNEVINGAIVEVHFGVLHWRIRDFDTFQADVDKVVILKPGCGHCTSNYKCPHDSEKLPERDTKKSRQETSSSSSEV